MITFEAPEKFFDAIVGRNYGGLSHAEIAEVNGLLITHGVSFSDCKKVIQGFNECRDRVMQFYFDGGAS